MESCSLEYCKLNSVAWIFNIPNPFSSYLMLRAIQMYNWYSLKLKIIKNPEPNSYHEFWPYLQPPPPILNIFIFSLNLNLMLLVFHHLYVLIHVNLSLIRSNVLFQTRDELKDALDSEMRAFDMDKVLHIVVFIICLYGTVLHCIALYCTVSHCIALYCTVSHCIALYCIVLRDLLGRTFCIRSIDCLFKNK